MHWGGTGFVPRREATRAGEQEKKIADKMPATRGQAAGGEKKDITTKDAKSEKTEKTYRIFYVYNKNR